MNNNYLPTEYQKFDCWSDANDGKGLRVFNYSTGKRYLTKVEKEPNVDEVNEERT